MGGGDPEGDAGGAEHSHVLGVPSLNLLPDPSCFLTSVSHRREARSACGKLMGGVLLAAPPWGTGPGWQGRCPGAPPTCPSLRLGAERQDRGPGGSEVPARERLGAWPHCRGLGSRVFVLKGGGWGDALQRHARDRQGTRVLLTDRKSDSGKIRWDAGASAL